jgi:DNA-binding XRE family transcriptional regulator
MPTVVHAMSKASLVQLRILDPIELVRTRSKMARNALALPFSGARLRETRERAGLIQQALADKCGLSRHQISRWETGQAKPGPGSLEPLVRGLAEASGRSPDGENPLTLDDLLESDGL